MSEGREERHEDERLAQELLRAGRLDRVTLQRCLSEARLRGVSLEGVLRSRRLLSDPPTRGEGPATAALPEETGPSGTLRMSSGAELDATRADRPSSRPPSGRQKAEQAPRRLGPYELGPELGRGGMGAVYRARHVTTGQHVALKVLTHAQDLEDLQRFRREADMAWQLDHPNVVRVLDVGEARGQRYLTLELLTGGSLHERIRRGGALPIGAALRVVRELAEGLAHAHERGVLHRDIKPGNVLFDEAGVAKLADFGLARGPSGHSLTRTGSILGTPAFMAPEQAKDSKRAGERSDQYGLGAVLFTALTGQPPLVASTLQEALKKLEHEPVARVRSLRPEAPAELDEIVARSLSKDPAARFPSVRAMVEALSALRVGGEREVKASDGGGKGLSALALALACLVLLCLGLGAWALTRGEGETAGEAASRSPSQAGLTPGDSLSGDAPDASPGTFKASPDVSRSPLPGALQGARPPTLAPGERFVVALSRWSEDSAGLLAITLYLEHRASADLQKHDVRLLRVRAWREQGESVETYDSDPKVEGIDARMACDRGRTVITGALSFGEGRELLWSCSALPTASSEFPRLEPLFRRTLRRYDRLWRELSRARRVPWGSAGGAHVDARGRLAWAAWEEEGQHVRARAVFMEQINKDRPVLSRLPPQGSLRWAATATINRCRVADRVHLGQWFEIGALPQNADPTQKGRARTLSGGARICLAPRATPLVRAPRDSEHLVIELGSQGTWSRISWGGALCWVKSEDLLAPPQDARVFRVLPLNKNQLSVWGLVEDPPRAGKQPTGGLPRGALCVAVRSARQGGEHLLIHYDHRHGRVLRKRVRLVE